MDHDYRAMDKTYLNKNDNNIIISPNLNNIPKFDHRIKIGVLASGNGSNFEALVKATKENKLNAEISILFKLGLTEVL